MEEVTVDKEAEIASLNSQIEQYKVALEEAQINSDIMRDRWIKEVNENTRLETELRKLKNKG